MLGKSYLAGWLVPWKDAHGDSQVAVSILGSHSVEEKCHLKREDKTKH